MNADRTPFRGGRGIDRRRFLRLGAVAAGGAALGGWSPAGIRARPPLDLLLRGGRVVDGTGRAAFAADVAVRDGRIEAVGALPDAQAAIVLDVAGLAVVPGFIDIHGHTDLGIFVDPHADSKIRQGVTTEIVGQDGSSLLPASEEMRAERRRNTRERYGLEIDFASWDELFRLLSERGHLAHFATMVGSGTVREAVIGSDDRPPTSPELERMRAEVERAIDAGAVGISSGLEYTPNAFAREDELVALARPFAGTGLAYASHLRNEADRVEEAFAEGLAIARAAGVPFQASHLKAQGRRNWPKALALVEAIERAARDHPVRFDRYPYTAYSTGLSSLFPAEAREGGTEKFLARLQDPAEATAIRTAVAEKIDMMGDWDAIQIAGVTGAADTAAVGRRLGEYAAAGGADPYDATVQLLVDSRNRVSIVGHGMSEENTRRFVAHPLGAICSDAGARRSTGPLSEGTPHPRAYGAFPRVFARYVREERALSLEEAVRKMTSLPASIAGLGDRGTVEPGRAADLVALDPGRVRDSATFEIPHAYPDGIPHVIVAGRLAVRDGSPTGALPGGVLTPL
ncbi:MAG TPA: D-aminoacylase [Gemmatimonadota bacterium]|nr:D-aminoacylase [Gemmatimonadota bacterium]